MFILQNAENNIRAVFSIYPDTTRVIISYKHKDVSVFESVSVHIEEGRKRYAALLEKGYTRREAVEASCNETQNPVKWALVF